MSGYTEEATSKYVQTKQWKIHINEAGSGHPIFFLHGGGPGATGWSNFGRNIQYLAEKYHCIAVDMPGYGGTDPVAPHQLNPALAVKLLMDAMGIEKAAICGNSMGGSAALHFAVNWNDRISHIITMGSAPVGGVHSTWPGWPGMGGGTEGLKALAALRLDPTPENFKKTFSVMVYDNSFITDELCQQRAVAAQRHPETIGPNAVPTGQAQLNVDGPSVLTRLTQIETPALIIHGRDDRAVPLESSLQITTAIKNSRLLVFNRCGHWAQLEHADEFNRQVDTFVGNV